MEYYKKILCVSYEELTGGDDPVVKQGTFKSLRHRGHVSMALRGGGEGREALIVYASLPEKYKARFVAKYGDPAEVLKKEQMKRQMVIDMAAREWYEAFEYDLNGVRTHLDSRLIDEYVLNASVLNALIAEMNDRVALSKALNNKRGDLWATVVATCERLREVHGHTLPANASRLRGKMADYRRDGYAALVSGKIGNRNTAKITEEAGRQIIALKRSRVPVLTDAQILTEFNRIAALKGWKPLKSERSLRQWLASPEVEPLWYDAVHGERAAHQRYDRKHRTVLPSLRDSLWYGDGTKLNLYYRDEEGKMRTINVYEVIDAATEVLLGYYIGESEDYVAQYHAYRMAVQTSGHKPYEIVYDNQGGHKKNASQGLFSKICRMHRPTAPYNGESKTIENLFYRFQSQVLHKHWNFTGQNVTTKKDISRPNLEFIEANVRELPTLEELRNQYAEARREWNEMPHPATGKPRIEMYRESVNEETQAVGVHDMIDMFWFMTEKPSTFGPRGIEIQVRGRKYAYEVYSDAGVVDMEWRRVNTYRQFYVQYDPYDMTSVRLLLRDGAGGMRFSRVAEPVMVIHRAQQEQSADEKRFIREMQAATAQERVERQVKGREIELDHGVAPEQHGLSSPRLKGLSAESQRQIERRVRLYSKAPEEFQLGRRTKRVSLQTFDELEGGLGGGDAGCGQDDGPRDLLRLAGEKL
ncbi:MAG: kinase [Bacteroidales bacterium]|nr:kinase [Bacteroidales bacterium]